MVRLQDYVRINFIRFITVFVVASPYFCAVNGAFKRDRALFTQSKSGKRPVRVLKKALPKHLQVSHVGQSAAVVSSYKKYRRSIMFGVGVCSIGLLAALMLGKLPTRRISVPLNPLKKMAWMISKKSIGCALVWLGYCIGSRSSSAGHFMQKIIGKTKVQKKAKQWEQSMKQQHVYAKLDAQIVDRQLVNLYETLDTVEKTSRVLAEQRKKRETDIAQACVEVGNAVGAAKKMSKTIELAKNHMSLISQHSSMEKAKQ